jgi:ribosomal protein L35
VGPVWNRRFKRLNANNYHLKRKKTTQNLRRKSRPAYIAKVDMKRVRKLIPYYKRRSLKRLY